MYPFEYYYYCHKITPSPLILVGLPSPCLRLPSFWAFAACAAAKGAKSGEGWTIMNWYSWLIQHIIYHSTKSKHTTPLMGSRTSGLANCLNICCEWDQYQKVKVINNGTFWKSEALRQCVHQVLGACQAAAILKDYIICQSICCFPVWKADNQVPCRCFACKALAIVPPLVFWKASRRLTSLQKSR